MAPCVKACNISAMTWEMLGEIASWRENIAYIVCICFFCGLFSKIYYCLIGIFPIIISIFYLTCKYVVYFLCGCLGQKERSENTGRVISDWKPGFVLLLMLLMCWIPSHTCSFIAVQPPAPYKHTHTNICVYTRAHTHMLI